ncbi:MAG: DUF616 domain-containing protein [Betaproteobacteria bacterium]|nr:DUF616 domain-containing protein [Betaproteobacteria bacterium]
MMVYTVITGGGDLLRATGRAPDDPHFVAFSDAEYLPWKRKPYRYLGWEVRPAETEWGEAWLNARRHMICPHRDFPEAEYTLYVDGTHVPATGYRLERLIEVFLRDTDLATFVHPHRTCLYREAAAVVYRQPDLREPIRRQMRDYRAAGYPEDHGLAGLTVLLRRHTPAVRVFNEAWWAEVEHYRSRRDQLSFPYVCWRLGMEWTPIPGHCYYNSLFDYVPHGEMISEGGIQIEEVAIQHDRAVESVAVDRAFLDEMAGLVVSPG